MKLENDKFGKHAADSNDARWADEEEIKNAPTLTRVDIEKGECAVGGIPLISDGETAYVDGTDTHTIIFGSTGSQKTRRFGMPLINILAMAEESFIVTDPKGELYDKTSGFAAMKGYNTFVLHFRDLKKSDFWNPLALPYQLYHGGKVDEAVSLINDLVMSLSEPQRESTRDTYFIDLACSQMLASMLFFIETATPEEANIYNFINFFSKTASPDDTEMLNDHVAEGSIADINFKGILSNKIADRTFANVSSCVAVMINPFIVRKSLCQVLAQSSFDIKKLGTQKSAIYIVVPDEKTTLHFLVTVFIKQTYEVLINEAQQHSNGMLPIRMNFVLDEFCNIPTIPDMPSMISAARSRKMRFFLISQGMWQLEQKYDKDAHTIKGNCDNWVFLTSREFSLLEEISRLCGKKAQDTPLISVSELQRFKKDLGEALILHGRNHPFVTELPDINEYKFKTYQTVKINERQLPSIPAYNLDKIIEEIEAQKRPLPGSIEVYGKKAYYDKLNGRKRPFFLPEEENVTNDTSEALEIPFDDNHNDENKEPLGGWPFPNDNNYNEDDLPYISALPALLEKSLTGHISVTAKEPQKIEILFPMYHVSGKHYKIYLVQNKNEHYLSDDGATYKELDRIFELSENDVSKTIRAVLKQYECSQDVTSNAFVIKCQSLDDVHIKLSSLIQAISFLLNMKIFYV
jgi:type IV secretion system protein VirD4